MKVIEMAAVLRRAAIDTQAFAVNNDDLDPPNERVLPFIINFLTDKTLRKLSAHGKSDGFQERRYGWQTALAHMPNRDFE